MPGESATEDRYHYYPALDQVRAWAAAAGLAVAEEAAGDDYAHFLALALPPQDACGP